MVLKKIFKKSRKSFASSEKVSTFAVPFETNGIFYGQKPRKKIFDNTEKK